MLKRNKVEFNNGKRSRINFDSMIFSQDPPTLEEALNAVEPLELSNEVKTGKSKIIVSAERNSINV